MLLQVGDRVGHALEGVGFKHAHRVAVADQEQRGLQHLLAGKELGVLPIAFEVAIPVQRPAKAVFGESLYIHIQVLLAAPAWQFTWGGNAFKQGCAGRFVLQEYILILHEQPQGAFDVGVQLLLGHALFLEVQNVVEAIRVQLAHDLDHWPPCPSGERHRHGYQ